MSMASLGVHGIGADDPDAPMPTASSSGSMMTLLTDDEAERVRAEPVSIEPLIVHESATRTQS